MPHPLADDIPNWVFQISAAADFKSVLRSGKPMGHCTHFTVTGAGTVTVKLKMPRDDAATEELVVEAGRTIPGKVAAIVSASAECFPITVYK